MAGLVPAISLGNAPDPGFTRDQDWIVPKPAVAGSGGGPAMTTNYPPLSNFCFTLPSSRVQLSTRSAMASRSRSAAAG